MSFFLFGMRFEFFFCFLNDRSEIFGGTSKSEETVFEELGGRRSFVEVHCHTSVLEIFEEICPIFQFVEFWTTMGCNEEESSHWWMFQVRRFFFLELILEIF